MTGDDLLDERYMLTVMLLTRWAKKHTDAPPHHWASMPWNVVQAWLSRLDASERDEAAATLHVYVIETLTRHVRTYIFRADIQGDGSRTPELGSL